jgi:DNA-binding MarR family transcriptional regulator
LLSRADAAALVAHVSRSTLIQSGRKPFHQHSQCEGSKIVTATHGEDTLTQVLRTTMLALVRSDEVDLTSRQFGVFLTVYMTAGPHTVRGLAAELNVSKPAITRALDRLGELGLARRKVDPMDRRSVLVQQTQEGRALLTTLRDIMAAANTEHHTAVA